MPHAIEALGLLQAAWFGEQAEVGKRWLDSLTDDECADRAARHHTLDQAFSRTS